MEIGIINYGIGNLRSVEKACQHLGLDARLVTAPAELRNATRLILPGVGNFCACMRKLRAHGFVPELLDAVAAGKPLLGICVGLQMLFESSEESTAELGLGLLKGRVRRFHGEPFSGPESLKVPHIGWNALEFPAPASELFAGLPPASHVYFVHSYCALPTDETQVLAWSDYGGRFCAAAGRDNVCGLQFHPEKSQTTGLRILKNFAKWR